MAENSSGSSSSECEEVVGDEEVEVISDRQFTEDYDWDIDSTRGVHESDEQWSLRRTFLEMNKMKLPKLRLQCLSQVFVNMEFLGCKYPTETMAEVAELSQGILEEYHSSQEAEGKALSQRTLVTASSMAQKRYGKGISVDIRCIPSKIPRREESTDIHTSFQLDKTSHIEGEPSSEKSLSTTSSANDEDTGSISFSTTPSAENCNNETFAGLCLIESVVGPLENQDTPVSVLVRSCQASHVEHEFKGESINNEQYRATFQLGYSLERPTFSAEFVAPTKKEAKQRLADNVIRLLKKFVFTIRIKESICVDKGVSRSELVNTDCGNAKSFRETGEFNGFGSRILKMMGWSGGGLGRNENGIEEPIDARVNVGRGRLGLGNSASCSLKSNLKVGTVIEFLKNEFGPNTNCFKELAFSAEFSNEKRAVVHKAAKILDLKSQSQGKEPNRFLVVKRKLTLQQIIREVITSSNGETDKYRIIQPAG